MTIQDKNTATGELSYFETTLLLYLKESHPHIADSGKIAVVHNGIIENYQKLIRKLESDYQSYKARMKQFINGQMDILDNPVYEMEFEIAGCEQTDGDEEDEQQKQFGNEQ